MSVMNANDGCGCFWINDMSVVWSWLLWGSVVLESWWCMSSALICCLTTVIPSFFLLGNFLLSLLRIRLSLAPLLSSNCFVFKAACTANVQYHCVLRWECVSSVKLISRRKRLLLGTLLGLSSESSWISLRRSAACFLWRYLCLLLWSKMLQ